MNASNGDDFARLLSSYDFSQPMASTSALPASDLQLTPRGTSFPLIPSSSAPSLASLQSLLGITNGHSKALPDTGPAPADSGGGPSEAALAESDGRMSAVTKRMDDLQSSIDELMSSLTPGDGPYDDDFWDQFGEPAPQLVERRG